MKDLSSFIPAKPTLNAGQIDQEIRRDNQLIKSRFEDSKAVTAVSTEIKAFIEETFANALKTNSPT